MMFQIALDRDLPISVSAQLKGQIEYGIASGALKPGEQLPSVRDLAAEEGVAHVTVSHVYRALKRDGLIVVRPGMGTYVAGDSEGMRAGENLAELQRLVDGMVAQALAAGFSSAQITHMVTARLAGRRTGRPRLALVGVFDRATQSYASDLRILLADLDPEVLVSTIDRLRLHAEEQAHLRGVDLVLTMANRVREVQSLLPRRRPPVRSLTFTVHPDTEARLRALPAGITLGVVSTFAEFLPTMLQGISRYAAPSRPPLCAVLDDADRVQTVLEQAGAVVYATGSEAIVPRVAHGRLVVEYLHAPDPASVQALRPLLEWLPAPPQAERRETQERRRA